MNYLDVVFEKGKFAKLSQEDISREISDLGFTPILITNTEGYVYDPHTHQETKLLAFLQGGMEVTVGEKVYNPKIRTNEVSNKSRIRANEVSYNCKAGDLLIVPGDTIHSAVVGKTGCKFFWSEKIIE